ncbi:uroporphyrinogen decarboxylase [Sulfurimicrobium lacus]|uniref:Uroporphyrinogen decarboxylase n=1 Tax=Sulfurimicrobium lacus TaxID=2715678 RepID=A0A6F8V6H5_9PROT|nr:uroporphyrinogen decarboxylase family protein [Sulfurimicrobium lacus]BCB25433.1 uroporphyrinogen decarboxylase [Sulfurimicrobium lacus]
MNSLERIKAALAFAPPDRTPAVPQLFGHAAAVGGVALRDYLRDGALLAACQARTLERYGHDVVFAFMDLCVETEALGSTLQYRENQYPDVISYALTLSSEVSALTMPDPASAGRMPELLKATSILRRELGDTTLVAGCVAGPMTLATQLLGIETALYLAVDDPARFEQILDFSTAVAIRYGCAQIAAGAHLPIVFDPAASPAVVPPQFFRELLLPRLQQVFAAFRQAGALANWLNIAGPTAATLPYYPEAGADIANFDYYVEPDQVQRLLPRTCVDGNMKSLLFVEASPDEVAAAAALLISSFARRGGFLLSSGCEIPPEAKPENIAAMVAACRRA